MSVQSTILPIICMHPRGGDRGQGVEQLASCKLLVPKSSSRGTSHSLAPNSILAPKSPSCLILQPLKSQGLIQKSHEPNRLLVSTHISLPLYLATFISTEGNLICSLVLFVSVSLASPQQLDIKLSNPVSDNQNVVLLWDKTESSTQLVAKKDVSTRYLVPGGTPLWSNIQQLSFNMCQQIFSILF